MLVSARQAEEFTKTADLLGFYNPSITRVYTEWCGMSSVFQSDPVAAVASSDI